MSRTDIRNLVDYRSVEGAHVLSIYLQTHSAESETVFRTEIAKISRGFEEESEQRQFQDCVARVEAFLMRFEARAETVVIMCNATGPLWVRQIDVRLPNLVRWGDRPYWQPFVEAIDEFEPYGVVHLEVSSARLLTIGFGKIHERRVVARTAKDDLDTFLEKVVNETRDLETECPNRLVLAGDLDIRWEFLRVAPEPMLKSVIGSIPVPPQASDEQLLQLTAPIARFAEREFETREVDELMRLNKRHKRVALGLASTLEAVNAGSIDRLLYTEGFSTSGRRCDLCKRLFVDSVDICTECNGATRPVSDLLADVVAQSLQCDASIEEVRGTAACRLKAAGSIGAFLRY
jgi:hypothetical protein